VTALEALIITDLNACPFRIVGQEPHGTMSFLYVNVLLPNTGFQEI
jgi:hypothetical protein